MTDTYLDWKHWSPEDFGRLSIYDCAYFDCELSGLSLAQGQRVLEVGFGNGSFLSYCRSRGLQTLGIEANESLVERARHNGFDAMASGMNEVLQQEVASKGAFDLIAAFDVFEHVSFDQLRDMLASWRGLLNQGGLVLARVPNGDSPFGRAWQHGDPTHITTWGSRKVKYLSEQTGFRVLQCRDERLPVRGLGLRTAISNSTTLVVRKLIERLLSKAYFAGDSSLLFAPNLVFVLESPK